MESLQASSTFLSAKPSLTCGIYPNSAGCTIIPLKTGNFVPPTKKNSTPSNLTGGEIYNAFITEGVGSELCGNHLVVIIQNEKANIYSEKVNILPIEGDGTKINPNYQIRLSSAELADGKLDKEPSRIIVTDITTIDKARLGRWIGRLTPECIATI